MAIWLVCYGLWYNAQLKPSKTPTANFYAAGPAYSYTVTLHKKDIEVSKPAITSWKTGDSDDASAIFSFATHRCPAQGGIST